MGIKIMLDAGHTGKKWNAGAVKGYYESAVMWDLHNMLAEELVAYGFEVGKTRKTIETELDVTARGKKAKGYDLFLSLHSNAADDKSVRRVVAIYQTPDSAGTWDETSKKLADKLGDVIADTMGVTYKNYSKLAGGDRDGDGKKDDNYYGVLHGARMVKVPGIILEHSFHSNATTCKWLMDKANLRKLAKAEAACLASYYGLKKVEEKVEKDPVKTEPEKVEEMYRVRKTWADSKSQKGAFRNLNYAKTCADENPGYSVFNSAGVKVYPTLKSVEEIAREVIDGKWGNGADRKKRLAAAGYDPAVIQKRVNEILL